MEDLSLHVLDIVQNSVAAGAEHITVEIRELEKTDLLEITVEDDGCGMSEEFVRKVTDPFVTTRRTRKVGMGIPLLKMAAEMTGGSLTIASTPGIGTTVKAAFRLSHIDRPPVGNMTETITAVIQGNPQINLVYRRITDAGSFEFDTEEAAGVLGDIPLNEPEVLLWISQYIDENMQELNPAATGK